MYKRSFEYIKIFFAVCLLVTGGMIYILFRSKSLLMFRWFEVCGLIDIINLIRIKTNDLYVCEFVKYNLPNALWLISYFFIIDVLLYRDSKFIFLLWFSLLPIISILLEFFQFFGFISGYFDIFDLFCLIVPYIIYLIYLKMRDSTKNKRKNVFIALVFIFYCIIAGGSLEEMGITFSLLVALAIIISITTTITTSYYKKKRLNFKKQMEDDNIDFDMSDKIGDDEMSIYFDKSNNKVMIAFISENGVIKNIIDNFEKSLISCIGKNVCVVDIKQRKAIVVNYNPFKKIANYNVIEYSQKDLNKDKIVSNHIQPQLNGCLNKTLPPLYVLVEEAYGFISVFKDGKLYDSFNYITKDNIIRDQNISSFTTVKNYGAYFFILDDYYKVLSIVSPFSIHKVLNYCDIVDVSYEEDGTTLYTKSTSRTISGALLGGALFGSVGAIVGGLSGDSKQNKIVKSMIVKILVKNTSNPTINININYTGEAYKISDSLDKINYERCLRNANQIKDLLSVIIDESNSMNKIDNKDRINVSTADELIKLTKLKEQGILTDEEFNKQKSKILN